MKSLDFKRMKVLIACEFSGIVREEFRKKGHDVWSCDLLPTEIPGQHYQEDVLDIIVSNHWDLMIAHPPCTYLCIANAIHYSIKKWGSEKVKTRRIKQIDAILFFEKLLNAPIDKICIENPKPLNLLTNEVGKYNQIIQPYWFGHPESKTTCLWLKNLKKLEPTKIVKRGLMLRGKNGRTNAAWSNLLPNNEERWKIRSTTFVGIARAMADQWG